MKLLIIVFIIIAITFGVFTLIKDTSGYIRVHFADYTIDANIWFAIIAVILAICLIYLLFNLLGWIFGIKKRFGLWNKEKSQLKAGKVLQKGYVDLIEGKWDSAEKHLTTNIEKSPAPVLNLIAAAHAAQQNGNIEQRDAYLEKAHKIDPNSKVAIDLTQARLQYDSGDLNEARQTLIRLSYVVPKNEQVNRMLLAVNRERGDWDEVLKQIPKLRKIDNFTEQEASDCEEEACNSILSIAHNEGIEAVDKAWQALDKKQRSQPKLINQYAWQLLDANKREEAEKLVRQALHKKFDTDLAYTYGTIEFDSKKQLRHSEGWLKSNPNDANLLLSLGRFSVRNKSWQKAKDYYKKAIDAQGSQEANNELGRLLEDLGESDKALELYRSGLEKVLPLPKPLKDAAVLVDIDPVIEEPTDKVNNS